MIGDTWYSAGTNRFRWRDDDELRPLGPDAGFKDYLHYRKAQGYNVILIIAAFPAWATDGYPVELFMDNPERTCVRSAWTEYGTKSAKNMENEGGRPFLFPGKVPGFEKVFPDLDRINPEYFHYLDRKIDYLNEQGFIPFIEVARRDTGQVWKKYHSWPDSYARYIQYVWSRYQANNAVFSPIHFDIDQDTIPAADYNAAIKLVLTKFGPPPYGTLLTANSNPSSLVNFGDDSWVTLHQMGNEREHDWYWYLTDIYESPYHQPALNGEPYYAGYKDEFGLGEGGYKYGADGGSDKDNQYVRSSMYGSFLSGGLAGHIYGAEGIWGADIEPASPVKMWDAFQWSSGAQMQHLKTFAFSIGRRFQELVPDANLVSPNKTHNILGYEGWAFSARTPDKKIFVVYFEKGCIRSQIRGALPHGNYQAQWFDPRAGTWRAVGNGTLQSNSTGILELPDFPGDADWGLRLEYTGPQASGNEIRITSMEEITAKMANKWCVRTFVVLGLLAISAGPASGQVGQTQITKWQYGKSAAVSLTYDDGSINQFRVAVPIMDTFGLPATFFIITGDIPGSRYHGTFIGRPTDAIVQETANTPTNKDNFLERASAIGFLGYPEATEYHTRAGEVFDEGQDFDKAYQLIDEAYVKVRQRVFKPAAEHKNEAGHREHVTWEELIALANRGYEFASHTVTHPRLAALDDVNLVYELEKSRQEILDHLGFKHTFSVECPYGTENPRAVQFALQRYQVARNHMPDPFVDDLDRWNAMDPA